MKRLVWIILPIALSGLGCAEAPVNVMDFSSGQTPQIAEAPENATYTLYENCDKRIESTTLTGGEPIGFAQAGNSLQAVAGSEWIKLESGSYSWVREPKRRPSSPAPVPSPQDRQQGMRRLLASVFQVMATGGRATVPPDSPSSAQYIYNR